MSLAPKPLETVKIQDPLLDFPSENYAGVVTGPLYNTYRVETADSASSSLTSTIATIQHVLRVPNVTNVVSPMIMLHCQILYTIVGPTPNIGTLIHLGTDDGPSAYPLAGSMDTLQVNINDNTISTNLNDYFHALIRYNKHRYKHSSTPNMLDQYQLLSDYVTNPAPAFKFGDLARNPLSSYGENSFMQNRGAFRPLSDPSEVSGGGVTTFTAVYDYFEPFFVSPLGLFDEKHEHGLTGIQNITFNINMDLVHTWSHASSGNTITTFNAKFNTEPEFMTQYLSPQQIEKLPLRTEYQYDSIVRFTRNIGSIEGRASKGAQNTETVQLDSVPRRFFIFAQPRKSDRDFRSSNSYASLTNVKIDFDNTQSLLAQANQAQLYSIARKNGTEQSWLQFSEYQGSILSFEMGTDVALPPDLAPGVNGKFTLRVIVDVRNPGTVAVNYDLMIVIVYNGLMTIDQQHVMLNTSTLSRADVLLSNEKPHINREDAELAGGAHTGGGIGAIIKPLKTICKVIDLLPDNGGVLVDPKRSGAPGGRMISRQKLESRLK